MARRQHHNSISLFPFLAVLVCAMGSLILLLLVMTRKIRHDQQENEAAAVVMATEAIALSDRSAEIADLEQQIATVKASLSAKQSQSAAIESSIKDRQAQIETLQQELSSLQLQLQSTNAKPEAGVSESLKEARELKAKEAALLRKLEESEKRLFEKQQLLTKVTESSSKAELTLQEKQSDLISLRARVEEAKEKAAHVSGTSTLLEFSNSTGTVRTPIVIDVSEKGFEILPNGIVITPADMEGFPVRDNPLLSAILTAHRHRSQNAVVDEPYVLLLIRPDGSLPFYGAQRVLAESNIHYGYELLEPDQQIVAGELDASETPAVQTAISDALKRRENLYAKLMAIAQQKSELSGSTGTASGSPSERRLAVRPDGRVTMDEGPSRRPLDGRFYAGGVAPPPSLLQNRPIGGYRGQTSDSMESLSAADAEKLADEFAARYAKQQSLQSAEPKSTAGGGASGSFAQNGTGSSRPPGEQKSAQSLFGGTSGLQSTALSKMPTDSNPPTGSSRPQTESSMLAGTTASNASRSESQPPEFESFASSLASPSSSKKSSEGSSIPVTPAESLLASGGSEGLSTSGSPDLSRVDPDLLARLNAGKKKSGSLATPVGITVFLDEHHMTVGQQPAMEVNSDTLDTAFFTLLSGINTEMEDARRKPDEPLMPIVKFVVSPGGERWRIPLARSLKRTGVHFATVYDLTPYMMTQDETGRASIP